MLYRRGRGGSPSKKRCWEIMCQLILFMQNLIQKDWSWYLNLLYTRREEKKMRLKNFDWTSTRSKQEQFEHENKFLPIQSRGFLEKVICFLSYFYSY
jgi:hypothetical protein